MDTVQLLGIVNVVLVLGVFAGGLVWSFVRDRQDKRRERILHDLQEEIQRLHQEYRQSRGERS
jgi:hypothetical protein